MKKGITTIILFSVLAISACKNKNKEGSEQDSSPSSSSSSTAPEEKSGAANQPKEYKVVVSPDSAILGKDKEALVKITETKALALQDADGKDQGTELTVSLNVTNKRGIGKNSLNVDYSESRLQLSNGTNITCDHGTDYLRAEPEATPKTERWVYKIPAGSKPTALNLFMDETRVSVKVSLEQ